MVTAPGNALENPAYIAQLPAGGVDITYYTDPLCCWSWAFEPQWRKLLHALEDRVTYRYCMAGLIPGWKSYHDPVNFVSRPAQMGPVWMHAREALGVPIHERIWFDDPPSSSYPACIAVKCAMLQSSAAGEAYLQKAREAVMTKGINIAREAELLKIAEMIAAESPGLMDAQWFAADMKSGAAMEGFRKDLNDVRQRRIERYPALIIRRAGAAPLIVTGYRTCAFLLDIITDYRPPAGK